MAMLTNSIFTSRGRSRSLVSAIGLILVGGGAYPAYQLMSQAARESLQSGFTHLSGSPATERPASLSTTAVAWNNRRVQSRSQQPYGTGLRLAVMYADGTQVFFTTGQHGTLDRTLVVVDPQTHQVRTISADEAGRVSGLRVVTYDDRMQVALTEEAADSDAFEGALPTSRSVRILDTAGAALNPQGRIEPSLEFLAAARLASEDLRYFTDTAL